MANVHKLCSLVPGLRQGKASKAGKQAGRKGKNRSPRLPRLLTALVQLHARRPGLRNTARNGVGVRVEVAAEAAVVD